MIRKYNSVVSPALKILDACILVGSWVLSYFLRKQYPLSIMTNAMPTYEIYLGYGVIVLLLWGAVFSSFRVYSNQRLKRRSSEAFLVLRAHATALGILIVLTYLFATYRLSRGVFLYFWILSSVLLLLARFVIRAYLRRIRSQGKNQKIVVIAGAGSLAEATYARLNSHSELGLKFAGYLAPVAVNGAMGGLPYLGSFSGLSETLMKHRVERFLICLSRQDYPHMEAILESLKDEMLEVILVPDVHEYLTLGCVVEDFDGIPLLSLNETPLQGSNAFMKRTFDLVVAGFAVLVMSPLYFLLALAVKLSSRGPVLYSQERMSLNGKTFQMLKFRSMRIDQRGDVDLLTKKNDDRVTPIGRWLRATSLDELPQFFNVLLGDMSLVGPRPERTWVVQKLKGHIPSYMLKHKVKAGITGWAQVNGWRGDTSLEKRIEYDLFYIRNWSLLFDVKIMVLTVVKGFINKNAY